MGFPLTGVKATVKGSKVFISDLGKMGGAVKKLGGAAGKGAGPLKKLGSGLLNVGKFAAKVATAGLIAAGAAAVGIGVASVKAAISMESAWAGVVKTTDGLQDEFGNLTETGAKLQRGFRDLAMEVPISVEELMQIGELGGQLGIAEEDLLGFTRTIADMGVSTDLTTEKAALGFARIANVMEIPKDQIANMGATIVDLGNNFAATESGILEFSKRMAGAGKIAGFSIADVMGLSTALASIGVNAEAGGTAAQKTLLAINNFAQQGGAELEILAELTGQTAEEFSEAWEGDAAGSFADFIEGLGATGDDAVGILEELGFTGVRMQRALLGLANAGDLTREAMERAGIAFEENTALTEEAAKRYATTESQLKLFKNRLNDVAITIGSFLLPALNKMLIWIGPILVKFGQELPGLINQYVVPAIKALGDWLGIYVPQAIQILTDVWNTVLFPAAMGFVQWMQSDLLPIFAELWAWLQENIPLALQSLSDAWTNVLLPAIQALTGYVAEVLLPVYIELQTWLLTKIPGALQFLADVWMNVLQPALYAIFTFINTTLIPGFMALVAFLSETFRPHIENLTAWLIERWAGLVAWVQENWPLIAAKISEVMEWITERVRSAVESIQAFWDEHGESIMNAIDVAWGTIQDVVAQVLDWYEQYIGTILAAVSGEWEEAWDRLVALAEDMFPKIGDVMSTVGAWLVDTVMPAIMDGLNSAAEVGLDLIKAAFKAAIEALPGIISGAWEIVKVGWKTVFDTIETLFTEVWPNVVTAIAGAVEALSETIVAAWPVVKAEFARVVVELATTAAEEWPKIKTKISELIAELPGIIKAAWGAVAAEFRNRWEQLKNVASAYWNDTLKPKVQELLGELPETVLSIGQAMYDAGVAIISMLKDGLSSKIEEVTDWFGDRVGDLTDMLPGSEPKDPSSPLRGLSDRGAAILINIMDGMKAQADNFAKTFAETIDVGEQIEDWNDLINRGLDPIMPPVPPTGGVGGGYGGGMYGAGTLKGLFQQMDFSGATDFGAMINSIAGGFAQTVGAGRVEKIKRRVRELQDALSDVELYTPPGMAMQQELQDLERELEGIRQLEQDLADQQQRSDEMDRRAELLKLITDYGLDAHEVLGDLNIADATGVELMEAMLRAMGLVNDEREREFANQEEMLRMLEEEKALREAQARLAQAEERQAFLERQQKLLDLIAEYNLDPDDILQGFEFGLDANMTEFLEAMARAIEQINLLMEQEMELGSPSKRWERYAKWTLEGFAIGTMRNMSQPLQAMETFANRVAALPQMMNTTTSINHIDNSRRAEISVGGTGSTASERMMTTTTITQAVMQALEG